MAEHKVGSSGTVVLVSVAAVIVAVLVVGAIVSQGGLPDSAAAGLVWLALSVAASFIPIIVLYFVIRAAVLSALREHENGRVRTVPGVAPDRASPPPWPSTSFRS
jgi:hypothetical protein